MSVEAELRTTQVDLGGLMKVLGQNLYSTPEVAVRELVQNAHDSCTRRALAGDPDFEARIRVTPSAKNKTLIIEDTGAGLTHDEIVRDLATVGSGASGRMRAETGTDDLIGAFGLGFLSAYFIADKVEVHTTSWTEPDAGWRFMSRGGERYQLSAAPARPVGTRVTLSLSAEHAHLAEPGVLVSLLRRHCGLLPLPIHVAGNNTPVNAPPPWRMDDPGPVRWRALAMEFAERFEQVFAPLCVMPIAATAHSSARGVVWIQDGGTYGTTDNRNVSVFVRGMLVDNDARDLLPTWAGFCGAVIESNDLTPTASRESLQTDAVFRAVQAQVTEALVSGLQDVAEHQEAAWRRVVMRHNEALLGAALCDERLFSLLAPQLKVPTSQGALPLEVVRRRARGRIPVATGDGGESEAVLFKAQQIPVVDGTRYAVLPFCKRDAQRSGAQVLQLGTRKGEAAIFRQATVPDDAKTALEGLFAAPGRELRYVRFVPATLPMVLVPDTEAALKARLEADEADRRISSAILGLARRYTARIDGGIEARLFINMDAPVIQALIEAGAAGSEVGGILSALAELFASGGAHDIDTAGAFNRLSSHLLTLLGAP